MKKSAGKDCKYYKIGQVARELQLSEKRIREYEDEGLIKPRRRESSAQRMYDRFDIARLEQIRALIHERGLTLTGIKSLIAMAPCWKVIECVEYERCAAYRNPQSKCWEMADEDKTDIECIGNCDHCPVYLLRDYRPEPLFERPRSRD